jgi:membrane protease YdiL (CAAX protease family)
VIGNFILALFYGYVYLKVRNIWVLGLFHGWLGALFFYTVVNRDPFIEVFGKYLN